jgi:hypothetical protein
MPVGRILNDRCGREHGLGHKHQHRMDLNADADNVHVHDLVHVRVHFRVRVHVCVNITSMSIFMCEFCTAYSLYNFQGLFFSCQR